MIRYLLDLHRRYLLAWLFVELVLILVLIFIATRPLANPPSGHAPSLSTQIMAHGTLDHSLLRPASYQGDGPFGPRQRLTEFPEGVDWLNTKNSLKLSDLKGKLVLLDFWTYCCINCMHVLPTLKQAESEFEKELVVVGVHSAKFETEKDTENIRSAILRYEIKHPVLNDAEHKLWNQLGVSTWPTLVLVDPEGYAIWAHAGEIPYSDLQSVLKKAVTFYNRKGKLDDRKVFFDLVEMTAEPTPLRFPGKVIADPASDRIFISDSNHNRIVVTQTDGTLLATIGSGRVGAEDGSFEKSSFNHPQGLAFRDETLWVADTENHLIRRIDLKANVVSTVAGTGKQTDSAWPGLSFGATVPKKLTRNPTAIPLGSPWDLWIHEDNLFIAMAGPHQIWVMDLAGKGIAQFAGNGREDIVDGKLLPKRTYEEGASSFAQPSGLSSDGEWLYVADSEGSSIRAVPLSGQGEVRTVIGTSTLKRARLFTFGDVDGKKADALLQHPLGVGYRQGKIYVADTYNNKLKVVDAKTGDVTTLAGSKRPGNTDSPPLFDEPGGLTVAGDLLYIADTNNHAIRIFDLKTNRLETLKIANLKPPKPELRPEELKLPQDGKKVKVAPQSIRAGLNSVKIKVEFMLPEGLKLNALADFPVTVIQPGFANMNMRTSAKATGNSIEFELPLPEAEEQTLQVAVGYYYCQTDEQGLCLADTTILDVPLKRNDSATTDSLTLRVEVDSK
jgi:thiol-disulfide isomerase/thioredoxin